MNQSRQVNLEGFVYWWTGWHNLGSVTVIDERWLKGSLNALKEELSPDVDNVNSWLTVADSTFGAWQKAYHCSSPQYDLDPAAQAGVRLNYGLPVTSHWIRMDPNMGSGDRTALNGIRLGCNDGTDVMVEGGLLGTWSGPGGCTNPGGAFVAARMRMEARKTGADNTAANAIQFKCSGADDGTAVSLSEGFAGDWTQWVSCPGASFICGLQVRFNGNQGSGDDTALSGAKIACCDAPAPASRR
ncbi:hypothetical protein GPECTOR_24g272 [Gonium pectorale]|uniref:Uncharacterized protein n=1 Tax=Gonium pectorale TaxID=33097 RepID=A0A150GGM0_GONPE|nr:hypothetical protein GPECTOR_24g272 [Gonium pectorale]|eukprot:KXZ48982.1 hypothetical protein GPECTOR_24g272 [Gonium pectorale]